MSKNNNVARAITRAQKTQERIEALKATLIEEEREADRVLGEAVRLAVSNPRSKWAGNTSLTVKEFYSLVVDDVSASTAPSEVKASGFDGSVGVVQHQSPVEHTSDNGDGDAGYAGGSQGF